MDRNLDYTLLYRVAKAYFLDQRTQQEIADVENFSRSQISRLLKKALDERLVQYTLAFPTEVNEAKLSAELCRVLGIERVVLVPSFYRDYRRADSEEVNKNLALGAGERMEELLGNARTVGLGWGRVMYNTSLYIRTPEQMVPGREFVPLIGFSGNRNPALQINTIVDRFGERFHADRMYVNMSSLQASGTFSGITEGLDGGVEAKWSQLDAAVIGIGGSPVQNKNLIVEFPKSYKNQIQISGAVGDILSQFFYSDGRILELDSNYRLFALNIQRLHHISNVIALAAGAEKVAPICAAAKMGCIKTLVTDYNTAKIIINQKGEILQ